MSSFIWGSCVSGYCGEVILICAVMISPLSATTQKHRQAFEHLHTESITLIKQGTEPRMDMVQCKTTNMIEILKLDIETDVCVLPLCRRQLFAAGRPDGKGHSQRALFTLLPLY